MANINYTMSLTALLLIKFTGEYPGSQGGSRRDMLMMHNEMKTIDTCWASDEGLACYYVCRVTALVDCLPDSAARLWLALGSWVVSASHGMQPSSRCILTQVPSRI